MARAVGQNEDRVPAPAGHAEAADEGAVLSAAGNILKKGPIRQQIGHKILIVHPTQTDGFHDPIGKEYPDSKVPQLLDPARPGDKTRSLFHSVLQILCT